jgi:hypothetical protein
MYKRSIPDAKQLYSTLIPNKNAPLKIHLHPISYHTSLLVPYNVLSSPSPPHPVPSHEFSQSSQIKPKPFHTSPVLGDHIRARGLGVFGRGEEHALVAGGFLFFAHAAGLDFGRALVAGGFV